jgi:transcriptional regulator
MRHTPHYLLTDPDEVKRLIRRNAWATYVSNTSHGLVASHYPTLLEETDDDSIVIVSHFGRPDEIAHELGQHEVLVIIAGPHGYVSPGWYAEGDFVPTWNHVTAHLYGVPEVVTEQQNFEVLDRLVDEFEKRMPSPVSLDIDEQQARRIAKGTVGLRMRVTRFDARAKLSQNKPDEVRAQIIEQLRADGPYANPQLAAEMERLENEHAR